MLLATLEEVLGTEIFNEAVKGAVAEAYFFLADIFIRWPDIFVIYVNCYLYLDILTARRRRCGRRLRAGLAAGAAGGGCGWWTK